MRRDLADLPPSVAEIAEVIGRQKALELIGSLPQSGSRPWRVCVYIPKRLPADHRLVEILGWHDAKRLAWAFAGMILQPSNCRHISRERRNERILELAEQGVCLQRIAEVVDLSPRQVREIIGREPLRLTLAAE